VQLYRYFVSQSSEFADVTLCVASQRVFVVVGVVVVVVGGGGGGVGVVVVVGGGGVYFVIDSVRKLLDTPFHSYKPRLQKDRKCRLAQYLPVL
jgi:hypothetical protein